jgi:hypothetical protein
VSTTPQTRGNFFREKMRTLALAEARNFFEQNDSEDVSR